MHVTAQNIHTLTQRELYVSFMHAMKDLIEMDAADAHAEWTAKECWKLLGEEGKDAILEVMSEIESYMEWGAMPEDEIPWFNGLYNAMRIHSSCSCCDTVSCRN